MALLVLAAMFAQSRSNQYVPAPMRRPPHIDAELFCSVASDTTRGGFLYEYSLLNHSSSDGAVDMIGLRRVGPCDSVEAPVGWMTIKGGYQGESRAVIWGAIGMDKHVANDADLFANPPSTAIFPGELGTGFRLRSAEAPETTGFVAEAFVSAVVRSEDEEPGPFTYIPSVWETSLRGTVYAPRLPRATSPRATDSSAAARVLLRVAFILSRRAAVRVEVLDDAGNLVAVPLDHTTGPGVGTTAWNGTDPHGIAVPAGTYFVRMTAADLSMGRHMFTLAR